MRRSAGTAYARRTPPLVPNASPTLSSTDPPPSPPPNHHATASTLPIAPPRPRLSAQHPLHVHHTTQHHPTLL